MFVTLKVGNWIIIGRKINRKIIGFSVALFIYTKIRSTWESPIFWIVQIFVKGETSVQAARSSGRIEFCNEDVFLNDIKSYNRKTYINSSLLLKWNVSTGVFEECVSQQDSTTKLRYWKKQGNRICRDLSYRRQKQQMFSYDGIVLRSSRISSRKQRWHRCCSGDARYFVRWKNGTERSWDVSSFTMIQFVLVKFRQWK